MVAGHRIDVNISREVHLEMKDGLIDVHHHARPTAFFDALAETGRTTMGGRPFPPGWTAEKALSLMDEMRIATAFLSAPDADLLYRDRAIALKLSRLMNELFARSIQTYPERFGGFASLPMPHLEDSLLEITYALDELKLDGVMLSTSYDGHYLGSSTFFPILSELNRRGSVAFVHPVSPIGMSAFKLDFPASLIEYAFDTTRCIVNLLRNDIPARFPGVRFIFSHAGGAAPYLAGRLSLMEPFLTPGREIRIQEDYAAIETGLRSFYYDTALAAFDSVLSLVGEVVGMKRMVFGSDYPQVPNDFIRASANSIFHSPAVSDTERENVKRGNALVLFPRLTESKTAHSRP
jgi:predicted TIM-barrel fold metal-dependent hydrolase